MGGVEEEGGGKPSRGTPSPPKNGFWTPLRLARCPSLSGVSPLFFLYQSPQLWEGVCTPCSSEELFFAEKNGGHRGKISVVDMVFLVFIGFLYRPPVWKVSL